VNEPSPLPGGLPVPPTGGNPVIDIAELPQLPVERFEALDPRYLRLRWMGTGVTALVVVVIAGVVSFAIRDTDMPWLAGAIAAVLLCLLALSAWLQRLEIKHLGYLIREKDLSYRSGVLSRSVVTVPFARVQNVTIERGPLERWQGLASLEVKTAAGEFFGGLVISGLNHETAQRLRLLVADRAAELADAEDEPETPAAPSSFGPAAPPQPEGAPLAHNDGLSPGIPQPNPPGPPPPHPPGPPSPAPPRLDPTARPRLDPAATPPRTER
jgi:membrane protein YdbS with pleckstrin-like domain